MDDFEENNTEEQPSQLEMQQQQQAQQKNEEHNSTKKGVKVAGKAAANYFTGGQGGKIIDAAEKIPVAGKAIDKVTDVGAKAIEKAAPGIGKALKKADDVGALDMADKAMSMGGPGGAAGGAAGAAGGAGAGVGNVAGGAASGAAGGANAAKNATGGAAGSSVRKQALDKTTRERNLNRTKQSGQAIPKGKAPASGSAKSTQSGTASGNANGSIMDKVKDLSNPIKGMPKIQGVGQGGGAKEAAQGMAQQAIEAKKAAVKSAIKKKIVAFIIANPWILAVIAAVLLIFGIFILIMANDDNKEGNAGLYGYEHYDSPCDSITVTGNHAGTYDLEEYIAGVVQAEVGGFNNSTVYQTFAIAARTYVLRRQTNCTIENSTSYQTFTPTTNEMIIQAVTDTHGIVLIDSSGNLMSTEYDAFCWIKKDTSFYTLSQQNQKIPVSWVNSKNITKSYKENKCGTSGDGGHGRGMSQWGALYLAEQGKTANEILEYYYKNVVFKTIYAGSGLEGVPDYPLDSSGSTMLNGMSLADFLASKGTSISAFNSLIESNVRSAGWGTRAGAVSAAVTLIGELNKYGGKIPYLWGGKYMSSGANGNWGSQVHTVRNPNGVTYNYSGLDCSGFVSWVIYNGGFKFNSTGAASFGKIGGTKVSLSSKSAVLQPGDIMYSSSHVVFIVGISSGNYICAEAGGKESGVKFTTRSFAAKGYTGVNMDSFYNDSSRVR